jgi:hypothetical protein
MTIARSLGLRGVPDGRSFTNDDFLVYTKGYVPYLRTYPGPRAP